MAPKKKKKKKKVTRKNRETRKVENNEGQLYMYFTGPFRVYTGTAHRLLKFLKAREEFRKNGS